MGSLQGKAYCRCGAWRWQGMQHSPTCPLAPPAVIDTNVRTRRYYGSAPYGMNTEWTAPSPHADGDEGGWLYPTSAPIYRSAALPTVELGARVSDVNGWDRVVACADFQHEGYPRWDDEPCTTCDGSGWRIEWGWK